ncbi:ABC transporter ATP-binding protein [Camelimonas lactis]|uniref:Oligopeptide transport system ATP-binding protein n=1 Tax=Camelimonas lactis TaxID=659006 RepID=A0A4R2GJP6_9HYPH|nr:ABC transporter ATP-binding protein [Camelimonas lactis]TCO08640.1 oligopeptide transport system ATP-binding protein [Camelimonas lactis]
MQRPVLEVRNLAVEFGAGAGRVRAVDDVSFEVNPGETLAIVGESGSGKSVTALSLLRLVPTPPGRFCSGEILFEGEDLLKASDAAIRCIRGNRIAMIFQEPMSSLNPALTVGLQIAEPLQLHGRLPWARAFDKARELLTRVRIPDAARRVNTHPHQFSGGMRQRAMIAMALACKPNLIIADEPTTALDVTVQAQILSLLKDLTKETNAALILITHDLGVVARYADRVCVMYAGRVVESGSAQDIYANPRHPYTLGLMASIPRLDQDAVDRLTPIEGQPPDLAALPKGCAFEPRCRYAMDRCRDERPTLEHEGGRHYRACFANVAC